MSKQEEEDESINQLPYEVNKLSSFTSYMLHSQVGIVLAMQNIDHSMPLHLEIYIAVCCLGLLIIHHVNSTCTYFRGILQNYEHISLQVKVYDIAKIVMAYTNEAIIVNFSSHNSTRSFAVGTEIVWVSFTFAFATTAKLTFVQS